MLRLACVCMVSCSLVFFAAGLSNSEDYPLNTPFQMHPGDVAVVGNYGFTVGFDSIAGDSRCPQGVICIWPGDAEAVMWARQFAPRQDFVLHTYYDFGQSYVVEQYETVLLAVDPYPVIDVVDPDDYVILVKVVCWSLPSEGSTWGRIKALYE